MSLGIAKIIQTVAESLEGAFTFVTGNADELNNKLDEINLPVFGMEENFAIDFQFNSNGIAINKKYSLVLYILFKSNLDDIYEERIDYYTQAEIAFQQFLTRMQTIVFNEQSLTYYIPTPNEQFVNGLKIIKSIDSVRAISAKNLFDANLDGLLVTNFSFTLNDNYDKCLNSFIFG